MGKVQSSVNTLRRQSGQWLTDNANTGDSVLVVLADAQRRQHLARSLEKNGSRILRAGDGESALQMIKFQAPNLILLEVGLAGKNGFEVCAELRDHEHSRNIPVILIGRGLVAEETLRGLKLGAVDYIAEPYNCAEVAARVRSQLRLERVRRDLKVANSNLIMRQVRHQTDLMAAANIQKSLLPRYSTENFEDVSVSWKFLPVDQVGGDLLGYTWLDEDHLAAYVIDVCGHGLPAAMLTAAISISLAPVARTDEERLIRQRQALCPRAVLEALDREYPLERFERPFTISYLVLNCKTGQFRCSRAGHPMPIIIRQEGRLESIDAGGTIIGLGHLVPFDEGVGKLNRGDTVFLYSDGVTECANESGTFGIEGLYRTLEQCWRSPAEVVCERVTSELRRFRGNNSIHDDVTLLALTYGSRLNPSIRKSTLNVPVELTY